MIHCDDGMDSWTCDTMAELEHLAKGHAQEQHEAKERAAAKVAEAGASGSVTTIYRVDWRNDETGRRGRVEFTLISDFTTKEVQG